MLKAAGLSLALALIATTGAYAKDDDDAKVPAAEVEKVEATLSTLGCKGYEGLKKEEQGIYEIDDAKCAMGTVGYQARQGLYRHPHLPLLTGARAPHRAAQRRGNQKASRFESGLAICRNTLGKMPTTPLPSAAILR